MRLLCVFCIYICFPLTLLAQSSNHSIKKGVLDLRNWDFEKEEIVPLKGDWKFFWKSFVKPNSKPASKSEYVYAPDSWTFLDKNKPYPSLGYATYSLKVLLPPDFDKSLALGMPTLGTAYSLYLDGELLCEVGKTSKDKSEAVPQYLPLTVPLGIAQRESFTLSLHVSNYHHRKAGLWRTIDLGLSQSITERREHSLMLNLFLVGSILIMALYHFGLFLLRPSAKSPLFFGLACLGIVVRILCTNDYFITEMGIESFFVIKRLEYCSAFLLIAFFVKFVAEIFPHEINKLIVKINMFTMLALCLADIVLSTYYASFLITPFQIIALLVSLYGIARVVKAVLRKRQGARAFLIGLLVLFFALVNDILHTEGIIVTKHISAYGFFVFIFSQAFIISQRFSIAFKNNLRFSNKLDEANRTLIQRSEDLKEANDELHAKNVEILQTQEKILTQRDFLDEQNIKLKYQNKQITSSIKAAEAIQQALLPNAQMLDSLLHQYFIINRPRDVVSGDFYWISKIDNKTILVVGDCTGHGVPGAFMTLIGHNILDKIIRIQNIIDPASILHALNKEIRKSLRQAETSNNSGMDVVILSLEKENSYTKVTFAGARNSLYYFDIEQKALEELKGTRKSIGGPQNREKSFKNKTLCLPQGSLLYMGSDGLQDQNDVKRNKFGRALLAKTIEEGVELPLVEQKQRIEDRLDTHMEGTSQRDDILWIGLKI